MNSRIKRIYEFGGFRLEPAERLLLRDGQAVALTAKVFDLLVMLVENRGRLITKDELLASLWPDSVVEESNLSVNVSALRKALGENPAHPQFIETVPRRGYRFVATVAENVATATPNEPTTTALAGAQPSAAATAAATARAETVAAPMAQSAAMAVAAGTALPSRQRRRIAGWLLAAAVLAAVGLGLIFYRVFNQPPGPAGPVRTLAVLPFRTVNNSEADSALAMGMADALITRLGNLQQISVRSTSAVMRYSGAAVDARAAGRELGVDVVLDGLVQKSDKLIRVSVQLLRVSDGTTIWGAKFDDYFTNIFAVQDSISEKMAEALSLRLGRDEQKLIAKRYTENTEAYQLFMQGRYYHNKSIQDKALGFYQAALDKDPEYPLPYAGMVGLYLGYANQGLDRRANLDKARASADKAIRLDPDLSEANDAYGDVKMAVDWDFAGAERAYQKALEMNPQNADPHASYALLCSRLGRSQEAISEIQRASQLDPVSIYIRVYYVDFLIDAGRYDEAIEEARKAMAFDPEYKLADLYLARAYTAKSMYDEALAVLEKVAASGGNRRLNIYTAYVYARAGRRAEAENLLNQYERDASFSKVPWGYVYRAIGFVGLGEKDKALALLEEAVDERAADVIRLRTMPEFNELRQDVRYQNLLKRIGLS